MKKLWALRHAFGMLLAFGLGIALLAEAVTRYPMYVGVAVLLLIGWFIAIQPRVRKERARIKSQVDAAFQNAYARLPNSPSLKISSSYGYPAFEVMFRTKAERDSAAAQNEEFKGEIDAIYKGYGPRNRPFSADMAIFFTYDAYLDELRAQFKTPNQSAQPTPGS
jgi:hypothetical protein